MDYSVDYFIRCVLSVLLGVLHYGFVNFMCAYVKCREANETISLGVCDNFIRFVLTILLGVVCYGCFNFICFVICVCVFL
jgi:hypothetical protein